MKDLYSIYVNKIIYQTVFVPLASGKRVVEVRLIKRGLAGGNRLSFRGISTTRFLNMSGSLVRMRDSDNWGGVLAAKFVTHFVIKFH